MKLWLIIAALALLFARLSHGADGPAPPAAADGQAIALFAGGAVELAYDDRLTVSELPRGRQLLLVISRHAPPQTPAELTDGLWIGVEVGRPTEQGRAASAGRALAGAIRRDLRRVELTALTPATLDGWTGVRQGFRVRSRTPLFSPPGAATDPSRGDLVGWREWIVTDWGRVEVHVITPIQLALERQREAEAMLACVRLRPPQLALGDVTPAYQAAAPVIGSWKSKRAVLTLTGAGEVSLRYDRQKNYELGKEGVVDYEQPVRGLRGRYAADADLLRIRWADGSLLNMRWRTAGDDLLITDHHGRTRRLSRVYR
ncbi:MAG: hypothetical protein AAGB00_10165 [Planctomycetota bacterium]